MCSNVQVFSQNSSQILSGILNPFATPLGDTGCDVPSKTHFAPFVTCYQQMLKKAQSSSKPSLCQERHFLQGYSEHLIFATFGIAMRGL